MIYSVFVSGVIATSFGFIQCFTPFYCFYSMLLAYCISASTTEYKNSFFPRTIKECYSCPVDLNDSSSPNSIKDMLTQRSHMHAHSVEGDSSKWRQAKTATVGLVKTVTLYVRQPNETCTLAVILILLIN